MGGGLAWGDILRGSYEVAQVFILFPGWRRVQELSGRMICGNTGRAKWQPEKRVRKCTLFCL